MTQDQFQSLRDHILNDIEPLIATTSVGADQFDLLLRVIQAGGASADVYTKAYESAKLLEDNDERLHSLLTLIDEMDLDEPRLVEEEPEAHDTSLDSPTIQ